MAKTRTLLQPLLFSCPVAQTQVTVTMKHLIRIGKGGAEMDREFMLERCDHMRSCPIAKKYDERVVPGWSKCAHPVLKPRDVNAGSKAT